MIVTNEIINPETARNYLAANIYNNRRIQRDRVDAYAFDMAMGKWCNNGTTITFDNQGRLIDGQHRLMAVIKSGATIQALVVRGVDDDAFKTIDVGQPRTNQQILRIGGNQFADKKNYAAVASFFLRTINGIHKPTYSQVEAFCNSNGDLYEWFYDLFPNGGNVQVPYMAVAFAAHLYCVKDQEIYGFIRGAIMNDFDPSKEASSCKYCVQCEDFRKTKGRIFAPQAFDIISKHLYSYVMNYSRLTRKDELYACKLTTEYRLAVKP